MTDPGATFKGNEAEKKSRKKREGGGDRWLGYGGGRLEGEKKEWMVKEMDEEKKIKR